MTGGGTSATLDALIATLRFQLCLVSLIYLDKRHEYCLDMFPDDQFVRVHIFSLAAAFRMWSAPHYRSPSYQTDLINNLSNVAIPGTGIPLSYFCHFKITALFLVLFINPLVCLAAAINKANKLGIAGMDQFVATVFQMYKEHLLHPDDWFSFWQLNCRLTSFHSHVTHANGFKQEDKWTFLIEGERLGIPVTPFDKKQEALVCKNKNVEGGMGIVFYKNAAFGGDWILQSKIMNAEWLNRLLPSNPPLSTMRIITISRWSLENLDQPKGVNESDPRLSTYIQALSCVLRLGRTGASTDHSSILFDVDMKTGEIKKGFTNAHWYRLGTLRGPWLPVEEYRQHPDPPYPEVTGQLVPQMAEALEVVCKAHFKMMADVPIVGWDVAFTDSGIQLLEVNLSCNFFRGSFDREMYLNFVESFLIKLDKSVNWTPQA